MHKFILCFDLEFLLLSLELGIIQFPCETYSVFGINDYLLGDRIEDFENHMRHRMGFTG